MKILQRRTRNRVLTFVALPLLVLGVDGFFVESEAKATEPRLQSSAEIRLSRATLQVMRQTRDSQLERLIKKVDDLKIKLEGYDRIDELYLKDRIELA